MQEIHFWFFREIVVFRLRRNTHGPLILVLCPFAKHTNEHISMTDDISSGSTLLRFCLMAKGAKGKSCVAVIQQALASPNTFVFGELLEVPNVKALAEGENKNWYNTLTLFAYGTYTQYKANTGDYAELNDALVKKLRQLSVVSIAAVEKSIPYSVLLSELSLENVRELEDLIIDCIYAGIIKGKLDQKEQRFQVDWAMGRDIRPGQIEDMLKILTLWCDRSETLMKSIQEKIQLASLLHDSNQKQNREFEARVEDIKANLKATMEAEMAVEFDVGGAFEAGGAGANKKGGRKAGKALAVEKKRR